MSAAPSISASGMSRGFERFVGAAIGEEAAFPVGVDERDQPPGLAIRIADEMRRDADRLEARCLAFDISCADAGDEVDAHAERGQPRRLIGRRAAGLNRNRRAPVRAARQRPFGTNDDVGHDVADDEDARRPGHSDMAGATGARTRCDRRDLRQASNFTKLRLRPKRSLRVAT